MSQAVAVNKTLGHVFGPRDCAAQYFIAHSARAVIRATRAQAIMPHHPDPTKPLQAAFRYHQQSALAGQKHKAD